MAIEYRPAEVADAAAIHRVVATAFAVEEGGEKWRQIELLAQVWQDWLVGVEGGEPVAAARAANEPLWHGPEARVLKGEVGYVAVLPRFQGQGVGSRLMQETVVWMRERGCAMARLGGLLRFYARCGFVPFPRRFYELPMEPSKAGATILGVEARLVLDPADEAALRPYHPARDWAERHRLTNLQDQGRPGAPVSGLAQPACGGPDESGRYWVYQGEDGLLGWVGAAVQPGGEEAHLYGGFDLRDPRALPVLLKRAMAALYASGVQRFLGRLPFDPVVERRLREGGVSYVLRELQTWPAGNMMRVVDLDALLVAVAPSWSRRLAEGGPGWSGQVSLVVGDQSCTLEFGPGHVGRAAPLAAPQVTLVVPARVLLLLVWGYRAFDELAHLWPRDLPGALATALRCIWRREPTATGPLG